MGETPDNPDRLVNAGIQLPKSLLDRLEAASGDIPRQRYVRRVLEEHLDAVEGAPSTPTPRASPHTKPARSVQTKAKAVPANTAKAAVKPIPKGGKK